MAREQEACNPTTAAMQVYGAQAGPDNPKGTRAGLVLLYAPSYEQFEPAYLLHQRDLRIGRDPSNDICIPEAAVSRHHARVHFQGGSWVLSDLGGRNGTLVNGSFVHEVQLSGLDEIRVGDAIFKFVEAGAEGYAKVRIDGSRAEQAAPSKRRIVGGYQIDRLCRSVERVAASEISVILFGESGTGKEEFARQVHEWSGRKGAFQAINCAAIPATLLESELFGHKRGAFSGADRDKVGIVKAADGGTLFLDEIGDMPLDAQAKLLRVLQSKEIIPVGASVPERVDVRVVCATHRDLTRLQQDGLFRGDLFARLNEYSVRLPPLRERKEDIYALCRTFLERNRRTDCRLSFPFMTGLLHYDWPYNVRELEAAIKRGVALIEGAELDAGHLPEVIRERMTRYALRAAQDPAQGASPWSDPLATHLPTSFGNAPASGPHGAPTSPTPHAPAVAPGAPARSASPASGVPISPGAHSPPAHAPHGPAGVPAPGAPYGWGQGSGTHAPPVAGPPPGAPAPAPSPAGPGAATGSPRRGAPTEEELRQLLALHRGNVAAVGREFGKERMQVHRWMKRYGINVDEYR